MKRPRSSSPTRTTRHASEIVSEDESPGSGSNSRDISPNKPPTLTPTKLIGYVCRNEKFDNCSTIVWNNGHLYRLDMVNLKPLAPLTPVLFSTTYIKGDLHEKHPTFLGIFDRPYQEGAGVILPERIKGIFSDPPEKPGFITFEWNPGTIFKYPVKSTLLRSHFPSVIFNTPVSLWFSLRPPHRNAANQTVYPFPKEIKAETKTVPVEKNTDIPPTDFLQELHSHINPDPFHVYAAIGLPENDVFPTLSYPDYYTLVTPDKDQKKVLSWKSIFDCMLTKYLPLKNTVLPGKDFYDYLVNSGNNMDGTKSVLLYPGRWGGFDLREAQALSQTILTETKFDVFICTQAHPLTTKDNVHEQNPIITGVGMYGVVKEVIFFNGVVGLGEDFLGQVHFSFPHNEHLFLLLRMRLGVKSVPPGTTPPPTPTPLTDMFVPITTYQPKKYQPPPLPTSSASQVCEDYFVASFVKGDKKTLGVFRKAGINYRLIPDIYRSWANYDIYRIYSSETKLSQESLKDLLSSPGFTGRGLMDGNLAETPCSPENKLRIIRMASLEGFGKVEHRGGPLTVLQELGLVDQVLPLSNWHYKVQLPPWVSDSMLEEVLVNYDKRLKNHHFHSFFTGPTTRHIHPPPPINPRRTVPRLQVRPRSALVIEHPPLRLTLSEMFGWAMRYGLEDCDVFWNDGPSGDCTGVLEFYAPEFFSGLNSFTLAGQTFKVTHYVETPKFPNRYGSTGNKHEEKSVLRNVLEVCEANPIRLPKETEENVKRVLEDERIISIFKSARASFNSTSTPTLPEPPTVPTTVFSPSVDKSSVVTPSVLPSTVTLTVDITSLLPPHLTSTTPTPLVVTNTPVVDNSNSPLSPSTTPPPSPERDMEEVDKDNQDTGENKTPDGESFTDVPTQVSSPLSPIPSIEGSPNFGTPTSPAAKRPRVKNMGDTPPDFNETKGTLSNKTDTPPRTSTQT